MDNIRRCIRIRSISFICLVNIGSCNPFCSLVGSVIFHVLELDGRLCARGLDLGSIPNIALFAPYDNNRAFYNERFTSPSIERP